MSDREGQIYAPYSSGHVSGVLRLDVAYIYFASFLEKRDERQCSYKGRTTRRCYAVGNPVGLMWCHGGGNLVLIDRAYGPDDFEMKIFPLEERNEVEVGVGVMVYSFNPSLSFTSR